MTKQAGRVEFLLQGGHAWRHRPAVAVDMACARATHRAGMRRRPSRPPRPGPARRGRSGGRVPCGRTSGRCSATEGERGCGAAARRSGFSQALLARIQADGDTFYRGHEGGFDAADVVGSGRPARRARRRPLRRHHHFSGAAVRPGQAQGGADPQPGARWRGPPRRSPGRGARDIEVNAPGTTSTVTLAALAEAGATQVEPGNGLHGTTPLHALEDLPELPAVLYVTEVSHLSGRQGLLLRRRPLHRSGLSAL